MDPRKDEYCRLRADGKSASAAAKHIGLTTLSASRWEKEDSISLRISQLRENSDVFSRVSMRYVVKQLIQNIEGANAEGKYKESNDAIDKLYRIIKADRDLLKDAGIRVDEPHVKKLGRVPTTEPAIGAEALRAKLAERFLAKQEPVIDVEVEPEDGPTE